MDRTLTSLVAFLDAKTRLLIVKDFRMFRRDPAQWAQVLIFTGLMVLYFTNMRRFYQEEIGRAYLYRDLARALDARGDPARGDLDAAIAAAQKSVHSWPVTAEGMYCTKSEVELLLRLLREKGDTAAIDEISRTCRK